MCKTLKFNLLITLLHLVCTEIHSQDTVFVQKHSFRHKVNNVLRVQEAIHVKTGNSVLKLEDGEWKKTSLLFDKKFVFYDETFFESDFIPDRFTFDPGNMRYLIPQRTLANPTRAMQGDQLFISVGGNLYEYLILPYYKHYLKEKSVRDIYIDDSIKVISTYEGIIINDSTITMDPYYSNGSFVKIFDKYYLCSDQLYQYTEAGQFEKVNWDQSRYDRLGHFRKLVTVDDRLYGQFTHAICQIDSTIGVTVIHQDEEYLDIEVVEKQLVFSTAAGYIYRYDTLGEIRPILQLNSRINDIYCRGNTLILSSNKGVFQVNNYNASTLQQIASHQNVVATQSDVRNNLWISTENGLFVKPFDEENTYPIIAKVEFNRDAILSQDDKLYVGAVAGLFEIDINFFTNNYLPKLVQVSSRSSLSFLNSYYIFGFAGVSFVLFVFLFVHRRNRKPRRVQAKESTLTLQQIESDIFNQQIISVDQLAEYYKTNPVQLNRIFKHFDTTPGKTLKKVKLSKARAMMDKGVPMNQIVKTIGYTADYIKKNLP